MTYVKPDDVKVSERFQQISSSPDVVQPSKPGVRPPRQQRSRDSLNRVLDAGAEILAEGGYAAFTIHEVARRANASTGLIYARFEHKAALFEAVLVREMTRMVSREDAALEALAVRQVPTADLVRGIVEILATMAWTEAPLSQAFAERTMIDPSLIDHVKRLRGAPRRIPELLLERIDPSSSRDAERVADMAFWITTSALERRVNTDMWRHWRPEPDASWNTFVADLAHVVQAFVNTHPPRTSLP